MLEIDFECYVQVGIWLTEDTHWDLINRRIQYSDNEIIPMSFINFLKKWKKFIITHHMAWTLLNFIHPCEQCEFWKLSYGIKMILGAKM